MQQQVFSPKAPLPRRSYFFTDHANQRCQERKVGFDSLNLVLRYGTPRPSRDGCFAMGLPDTTARQLVLRQGIDFDLADDARSIRAIVTPKGVVVTVMKRPVRPFQVPLWPLQ
jgi:hypothetical protein